MIHHFQMQSFIATKEVSTQGAEKPAKTFALKICWYGGSLLFV
jgi:hypothetical protein